ncbi:MAG: hypothetical protein CMH28_07205 [Micavibrio sp.]|nr:hypothetical protein [Micavibrio sp.]|tara:strand:- start:27 stop:503 length:477 start_codon:yes stop_codon:yes gene_type:complete
MRLIFVITSLIVLTAVLPVFASAPNPIEPLLEKNRVLLVFAPARTDQNYLEIKNDLVANKDGMESRDMQVIYIFPTEIETAPELANLDSKDPANLRSAYDVELSSFKTFLIDRNGEIEIESTESVAAQDIFEKVDRSPIRKVEMFLPNDDETDGTTIL